MMETSMRFGDGSAKDIGTPVARPQTGDGDHHDWVGVGVVELSWPVEAVPTYDGKNVFDNPYFLELKGRATDLYTLIAAVEPQDAGHVTCDKVTVSSIKNAANRTVNCTAIAHEGYVFSHWDNACGTSLDCAVTLDATRHLSAIFSQP